MFFQYAINLQKKIVTNYSSILYWILILLYLGYFLYTLVIIGIAIDQGSLQESSWFNYLILDGLRIFGFILAIKGIILYALLHTNKSAYFLALAQTAICCNYFWFVEYNTLHLGFNLIFLVVMLLSWKSFNLYHPKFNLERRLLLILTFFVSLLFFQRFGFKVLKTSFLHHFGFLDLITSYLNVLINPESLFSYEQIEPLTISGWIFFYCVLFAGAGFLIISLILLLIPNIGPNPSTLKWNPSVDTYKLAFDSDSLAVFKLGQNLSVFYGDNLTIYYKIQNKICFVLGDPVFYDDTDKIENPTEQINQFIQLIHKQGRSVCFYQTSKKYLDIYKSLNLIKIQYAQEAYLTQDFDLSLPIFKPLRNSHNRIKKDEVLINFWQFDQLTQQDYNQFEILKQDWMAYNGYKNTGFTSGYNLFQKDLDGYFVTVTNSHNEVLAIFTFLPFGGATLRGLSLDYILRNPQANSSLIEGALVSCSQYFFGSGFDTLSLGLAPDKNIENKTLQQLAKTLRLNISSSGLRNFKQKFHPLWQPRYIVIENYQLLPNIYHELQKLM